MPCFDGLGSPLTQTIFNLKQEWTRSKEEGRPFRNPVDRRILRWRSQCPVRVVGDIIPRHPGWLRCSSLKHNRPGGWQNLRAAEGADRSGSTKMPEFIYVVRAMRPEMLSHGPTVEESAVLERHSQYVADLVHQGTALIVGRTLMPDAHTFGLVIFRSDDEEAAERLAHADPAVAEGVMTVAVYPFRISLLSDTWEQ